MSFLREIENLIGQGDKRTLYSILHWILQRVPDLKRRAYLAKFLVTLAIPDDYMMDAGRFMRVFNFDPI